MESIAPYNWLLWIVRGETKKNIPIWLGYHIFTWSINNVLQQSLSSYNHLKQEKKHSFNGLFEFRWMVTIFSKKSKTKKLIYKGTRFCRGLLPIVDVQSYATNRPINHLIRFFFVRPCFIGIQVNSCRSERSRARRTSWIWAPNMSSLALPDSINN